MDFPNFTRSALNISNDSCSSLPVKKENTNLRTAIPIILTVVAVTNNLLVIFLVFSAKQLRKNINFYIVNMAVSDIITSLAICMKYIFSYIYEAHGISVLNDIICKVINFFKNVSPTVSLLTLLAISSDRYRAASSPLNVTNIPKACFVSLVLLTWIIPAIIFVYEAVNSEHIPETNLYCKVSVNFDATEYLVVVASLVFVLYVCLIVINIIILRRLRQSTASLSGLNEIEKQKRNKKFRSAVKMVLCSLVVYILCTSPFLVYHVNIFHVLPEPFCTYLSSLSSVFHNLIIANSALGPVIYFIFLQDFREAFKKRVYDGICWIGRVEPAADQHITLRRRQTRSIYQNNPVFELNEKKNEK